MAWFRKKYRHPDPRVRLQAVAGLSDTGLLVELACGDDSPRVRLAAVERLTRDEDLQLVALDGKFIDARLAAVDKIASQQKLAEIIKLRKNFELMGACFARIHNREILEAIANDTAYNPAARRLAVEQFADESFLSDVEQSTRTEAADSATESSVDALLDAYGDVKVVRAIGRFRRSEKALRALGAIARRGGQAGEMALEYLCRALASSNTRIRQVAEQELGRLRRPELVAQLATSLDDPRLAEPIERILRAIGTPAARQALGEQDG